MGQGAGHGASTINHQSSTFEPTTPCLLAHPAPCPCARSMSAPNSVRRHASSVKHPRRLAPPRSGMPSIASTAAATLRIAVVIAATAPCRSPAARASPTFSHQPACRPEERLFLRAARPASLDRPSICLSLPPDLRSPPVPPPLALGRSRPPQVETWVRGASSIRRPPPPPFYPDSLPLRLPSQTGQGPAHTKKKTWNNRSRGRTSQAGETCARALALRPLGRRAACLAPCSLTSCATGRMRACMSSRCAAASGQARSAAASVDPATLQGSAACLGQGRAQLRPTRPPPPPPGPQLLFAALSVAARRCPI